MSDNKYEPVTFEDSEGNVISNDPVWLAKQTLKQYGVEEQSTEASAPAASETTQTASTSDDESMVEDYAKFDGAALKKLAKERNVDIKGLKTVGEVRQALIAADAATDEDEDDEDDNESDESAE